MPVVEDGKVIGGVRELTLARLLHSRVDPRQVTVREIMARPMPTVDEHVDLDEIYRLLSSGHSGVVVVRGGELTGVVTRIDLVNFWDDPFNQDFDEAPAAWELDGFPKDRPRYGSIASRAESSKGVDAL